MNQQYNVSYVKSKIVQAGRKLVISGTQPFTATPCNTYFNRSSLLPDNIQTSQNPDNYLSTENLEKLKNFSTG